jgi:hypothetical protein
MMDFIKEALRNDTSAETLIQQEYVKQSQRYHGGRSFQFISDYYFERQRKHGFIDEHIFAQGFEKEDFLKVLAKEKGLGPNVDFYSMQEMEALAKKFKEEATQSLNEEVKDGEGLRGTMAGFFDDNLRSLDGGSAAKKMSLRRPTKKIDGTILSRHKNVVCIVQG